MIKVIKMIIVIQMIKMFVIVIKRCLMIVAESRKELRLRFNLRIDEYQMLVIEKTYPRRVITSS